LNEDDKTATDVSQNARYNIKFRIVEYILTDLHFNFLAVLIGSIVFSYTAHLQENLLYLCAFV
jgi:hypothetical protein